MISAGASPTTAQAFCGCGYGPECDNLQMVRELVYGTWYGQESEYRQNLINEGLTNETLVNFYDPAINGSFG